MYSHSLQWLMYWVVDDASRDSLQSGVWMVGCSVGPSVDVVVVDVIVEGGG